MDFMTQFDSYVLQNYTRYPVTFVKGQGMSLWDQDCKEYLDFFPGWGVANLGHCHPAVVQAVCDQVAKLIHVPNVYYTEPQGKLAEKIISKAFPGKVFFCNSGAEANEAAIKLARKRNEQKYEIISLENSFHGRTMGAMTATGQNNYRKDFVPLPNGFRYCPINDVQRLKELFNEKTAALLLEPIQGEGGINLVSKDFIRTARALCDEHQAMLIVDEVQTGMGRTGTMFAFEQLGVVPDAMSLAKALGGGVPIGALVVSKAYEDVLGPGSHASTFGGNPLACSASLAVFEAFEQEDILENVAEMGAYLNSGLAKLEQKHALIEQVRGVGLMIGCQLSVPGAEIVDACRAKGLLINCTQGSILRLMPALNVSKQQIDQALKILDQVFSELKVSHES